MNHTAGKSAGDLLTVTLQARPNIILGMRGWKDGDPRRFLVKGSERAERSGARASELTETVGVATW